MIQEVPVSFSNKVVVDHGSEKHCPSAPPKQSIVKDLVIKAFVLASMFSVFLVKGNTTILRFNTPSRVTLLSEIDSRKHELESFQKLKKQYVDEETQLNWDKQHISESEDIVTSMLASSQELSERFHDEEHHIRQETEHMHKDLQAAARSNSNAAEQDHDSVRKLSRDIQETYKEVKQEHEETIQLRRQIAKTMEELRQKNIAVPEDIYERLNSLQ